MLKKTRNTFLLIHYTKKIKVFCISIIVLLLFGFKSNYCLAQDSISYRKSKSVLDYAPYKNKYRIGGVSGVIGGAYVGSMIWLNSQWYAQYPRSIFQFFNDAGEWNQIDKCGHIQAAYVESYMSYHVFRWMGLNQMEAAGYSALASFLAMSSIEVLDGFSAKWGASWSDLGANAFGSLFAMGQNMAWGEQRMMLKMSMHLEPYPQGDLRNRANDLYGTNLVEKFLKDYNNMNFWLSINPAKFNPKQKHAKWLSIAVGYGAGNMYGGFENKWTDKNGIEYDYNHVKRYRKFFISMDYDLSQVKTKTRFGRVLLGALNWIKLPAPAIEFNTLGQVVFHPCYFLNMEMPIYFKK
jgi:hypothetical protein